MPWTLLVQRHRILLQDWPNLPIHYEIRVIWLLQSWRDNWWDLTSLTGDPRLHIGQFHISIQNMSNVSSKLASLGGHFYVIEKPKSDIVPEVVVHIRIVRWLRNKNNIGIWVVTLRDRFLDKMKGCNRHLPVPCFSNEISIPLYISKAFWFGSSVSRHVPGTSSLYSVSRIPKGMLILGK